MIDNKKLESVDFFGNGLCTHCHLARRELTEFRIFNEASEAAWGNRDKQLQEHLDSILVKYPQSSHDEIVESYGWDLHVNQVKYPSIHRHSIILTVFSFLEHELNSLCYILSESVNSEVSLKDLKDQGVERAFLYLRKIAGFELNRMSSELAYIRALNSVRNHIVHNGGALPQEVKHKANVFVDSHPYLDGEPGRSLRVRGEFVPSMIEILMAFFEQLEVQVQGHIQAFNRGT
ncbi:hypothetical protein [Xanthomonas graminis]|uniref:Cthe-2314-like HEPN domain-containing protein n=1 Tax=Xanthomonas graminis pv. arrhenatheri LMG 727 TaxID=1195923 RepID=A0A0K2ZU54_9XANT|nr:hypothetical protein [Xanthomonas translucens]UKE77653.1 hypothetical protein KM317_20010 [Xanthomonas translucens pv. arrhenatheri]CTP89316.1 hypothetical protein XTALMG727_2672 [Xanthomonas translucens pv. arrhenatheri LMG 727]